MSSGLKTLLIILIIIVFGAIGYFVFIEGDGFSTNSLSSSIQTSSGQPVSGVASQSDQGIDADQISQEFLTQLLNLRRIRLRDDIFNSPSFISLVDFTLVLVQMGNEGRLNPFAPFGAEFIMDDELNMDIDEEQGSLMDGIDFVPVIPESPPPTQQVIINNI